jgi:hypothetical protein
MRFVRIWASTSGGATAEAVIKAFGLVGAKTGQSRHAERFTLNVLQSIGVGTPRQLLNPTWVLSTIQASWWHVCGEQSPESPIALYFAWDGLGFTKDGCEQRWEVLAVTKDVEISLFGTAKDLKLEFVGEMNAVVKLVQPLVDLTKWGGKEAPFFEDDDADDDFKTFEGPLDAVIRQICGGS